MTDITPLHELQERERRYLYTLAHNLRAPTTIVQGNLQLLLEGLQPNDCVQPYRQSCRGAQRGLNRMSMMVDDFTLVTQLEEGPITLNRLPVALAPFLHVPAALHCRAGDAPDTILELPADCPRSWPTRNTWT